MSYIKISPKGRAFLKKSSAAAIVSAAIATKKSEMLSEEGLVIKIGDTSVTVKSAMPHIREVIEA